MPRNEDMHQELRGVVDNINAGSALISKSFCAEAYKDLIAHANTLEEEARSLRHYAQCALDMYTEDAEEGGEPSYMGTGV